MSVPEARDFLLQDRATVFGLELTQANGTH